MEWIDISAGFNTIGVDYISEKKGIVPIDILSIEDNGVKANKNIIINNKITINNVNENDIVGFMKGDKVDINEAMDCFKNKNNNYKKEGSITSITVLRNQEEIKLTFPAKYKNGVIYDIIKISKNMTASQKKLFDIWTAS